ncbi:YbaK/prolyl-tRNA synthetase associated region [Candidatus Vecturithrix granuli]|uniref:YbaK/prolyl-tRNA synthetase associated region n=1 Tax=Vecturithrix granuli TaxID=1499967 RepID=A0A081C8R1_VECG1|nr:YbaK/prolyl-tRNA synthetase associated region [Candidatus Vecturithrix granuli]
MAETLSSSAQKVQDALHALGMACQVVELPATTRSAKEAAHAIGCQVGQIVKSLVFRGQNSNTPILALVSGANRVNEKTLSTLVAEPIQKADADFVREKTGFAIGGVPPVGHRETFVTFIDENLFQYQEIWAAAGTPHAVFKLTPDELKQITDGQIITVT